MKPETIKLLSLMIKYPEFEVFREAKLPQIPQIQESFNMCLRSYTK